MAIRCTGAAGRAAFESLVCSPRPGRNRTLFCSEEFNRNRCYYYNFCRCFHCYPSKMNLIDTIAKSDTWKADLLRLPDSVTSHALVACAELVYPIAECEQIRGLMPSIRKWSQLPGRKTSIGVASELFRYIHDTGLYQLGGAEFLELPTGRWPNVLEDTTESFAEDSLLYAANSIATIGQRTFFGCAGDCLEYAECSLRRGGLLVHDSFKKLLVERLRQDVTHSG